MPCGLETNAVDTELTHHMRPEVRDRLAQGGFPKLQSEDIADAIRYMVTRPRHMGINEMLIRPTEQVR